MRARRCRWMAPGVVVASLAACSGEVAPPGARTDRPAPAPGTAPGGQGGAPPTEMMGTTSPGEAPVPASPPAAACRQAPPPRIWRLTDAQFANTVATFFAGRAAVPQRPRPPITFASPFEAGDSHDRFTTYASFPAVREADLNRLMRAAEDLARAFVSRALAEPGACLGTAATFGPCLARLVEERGPLLFQRPVTAEEVEIYQRLGAEAVGKLGAQEAAVLVVQVMLSSPQFLYRSELGLGAERDAGRRGLDAHEVAAALAYALTDWPPDEALWQAARSGQLHTPEQIQTQVRRLLGNLKEAPPPVRQFFREYLHYDELLGVFKEEPWHAPEALLGDTEALVAALLAEHGQRDFLRALLTTRDAFVSKVTAPSYGFAGALPPNRNARAKAVLPATERAGVLTQPAFLASLSDMDANLPARRGEFMSESLLCRQVPPLPMADVPPLPPARTLRERFAVHSQNPACSGCHKLMDPLGLALEVYDHLGRYRTMEGDRPADGSGVLDGAGSVDGAFAHPVELFEKLARSEVVEGCFTVHAFRYFLGRAEDPADACAIAQAQQAYRTSGGDLTAMLASFFGSDAFLLRSAKVNP